ncbi:hypothetical protein [Streptacidiphilus melanogenes]|uniref:hypothetical protein n=1 Tax=Streptacidiphilus melanogenes TaxID=411235 RepID=UPI0005AA2AA2|nr:hypothetical protein [Streptacidiphilus melanogenes]
MFRTVPHRTAKALVLGALGLAAAGLLSSCSTAPGRHGALTGPLSLAGRPSPVTTRAAGFELDPFLAHEKRRWGITVTPQQQTEPVRPDLARRLSGSATVSGSRLSVRLWLDKQQQLTQIRCSFSEKDSPAAEGFIDDCASVRLAGASPSRAVAYVHSERRAIAARDAAPSSKGAEFVAPPKALAGFTYVLSAGSADEVLSIRGQVGNA